MPNPDLEHELIQLKTFTLRSEALLSAARSLASIPTVADQPNMALVPLTDAVDAQQQAITRIQNILERILA